MDDTLIPSPAKLAPILDKIPENLCLHPDVKDWMEYFSLGSQQGLNAKFSQKCMDCGKTWLK